jgi:hypothetical protein
MYRIERNSAYPAYPVHPVKFCTMVRILAYQAAGEGPEPDKYPTILHRLVKLAMSILSFCTPYYLSEHPPECTP